MKYLPDEKRQAAVLRALLSRPERFTLSEIRLPETGKVGYELSVQGTITIDGAHMRALPNQEDQ